MDRWADADDDTKLRHGRAQPQGRVAAEGLGGFVRSAGDGPSPSGKVLKIEIVSSKKEQIQEKKRTQDVVAMPPPPPKFAMPAPPPAPLHAPAAPSASAGRHSPSSSSAPAEEEAGPHPAGSHPGAGEHNFKAPAWASDPVPDACLEVYKGDTLLDAVQLDKTTTVFGRHISADVLCDHPSLSRLHAAVCFQGMTGKCIVMDLGSTHGTFVDGKRVEQAVPMELRPGSELRFAASTRRYVYKVASKKASRSPPSRADDVAKKARRFIPDGS